MANSISDTSFLDNLWREPVPFDLSSEYGLAIAHAVQSYKVLGRLDPYSCAAQGLQLMKMYGKPAAAIELAVQRLARDALGAEAANNRMSTADLGYWFGRHCEVAELGDAGAASEANHLERKRKEREDYKRQRKQDEQDRKAAAPAADVVAAAQAFIAKQRATAP